MGKNLLTMARQVQPPTLICHPSLLPSQKKSPTWLLSLTKWAHGRQLLRSRSPKISRIWMTYEWQRQSTQFSLRERKAVVVYCMIEGSCLLPITSGASVTKKARGVWWLTTSTLTQDRSFWRSKMSAWRQLQRTQHLSLLSMATKCRTTKMSITGHSPHCINFCAMAHRTPI